MPTEIERIDQQIRELEDNVRRHTRELEEVFAALERQYEEIRSSDRALAARKDEHLRMVENYNGMRRNHSRMLEELHRLRGARRAVAFRGTVPERFR